MHNVSVVVINIKCIGNVDFIVNPYSVGTLLLKLNRLFDFEYTYIYIYIQVDQTLEFVGGTHCIDGLGHVKLHATGQFAILMLDFA